MDVFDFAKRLDRIEEKLDKILAHHSDEKVRKMIKDGWKKVTVKDSTFWVKEDSQ